MGMYTVKQGDYLVKIAKAHGMADWRRIYNDPQNEEFRQKRPNPDLIYPGDRVYIPDKAVREVTCETEKLHTFIVQKAKVPIEVVLESEDDEAMEIAKYELKTNSKTFTRTVDDEEPGVAERLKAGIVRETVTPEDEECQLKVWLSADAEEPDYIYTLKVGHLDPVEEISGIQARLNNLGFNCGKVDGDKGPKTEKAVKDFQAKYGLKVDGDPGPKTQAKLREVYGA